jgi:hypothetical protein
LRHLLSQGLVRGDHQARANVVGEETVDSYSDESEELTEQRSHRNSKYRPDCWGQDGDGEGQSRGTRGTYRRGRGREEGRGSGAPCLWETGYYMGDTVQT